MLSYQQYKSKAISRIATRRQRAFARLQKKTEQMYKNNPNLQHLEAQRQELSQKVAQELSAVGALHNQTGRHIATMNKVLEERYQAAGVRHEDFLPDFECTLCGDTGRYKGHICGCVHALINELIRDDLAKATPLELSNFDSFDIKYYTETFVPELGKTSRAHMQDIYDYCKEFATHFSPDNRSILMIGEAGLGKTHLALAIANEVLKNGFTAVYVSAGNIFAELEAERRSGASHVLNFLTETQMLIIDDLGSELVNAPMLNTLYNILNQRLNAKRCTIYTTNITTQDMLCARYTEKISSRLLGSCDQLHFAGEDIRIKKVYE